MRGIVLVLLAVLAACGSPSNTQFIPVGSRCGRDSDCGTSPYTCNLTLPAGYCTKTCSMSDSDCPTDSKCVVLPGGNQCRRGCTGAATDCRVTPDGYSCKTAAGVMSSTVLVCDF
jgi:hypothetical protein